MRGQRPKGDMGAFFHCSSLRQRSFSTHSSQEQAIKSSSNRQLMERTQVLSLDNINNINLISSAKNEIVYTTCLLTHMPVESQVKLCSFTAKQHWRILLNN